MASSDDDPDFPEELLDTCANSRNDMEEMFKVLEPLKTLKINSTDLQMDRIQRARLHFVRGFALTSMYWMYLNTCGINPRKHKIKEEVERYRYVFNEIGDAMRKKEGITMIDKDAAERFIRHALWTHKTAKASDASSNSKEQNKSMREPTAEEHEEEPITKKREKEHTTEKRQRAPIREKHQMGPSTSKETHEKSKKRRQWYSSELNF